MIAKVLDYTAPLAQMPSRPCKLTWLPSLYQELQFASGKTSVQGEWVIGSGS